MDLPYTCDYAKSSLAVCRGCDLKIIKNTLRVAIMLQSRHFDGMIPNWYHFHCFFIEHMPESTKEIEHFNSLRWEDQNEIGKIIEKGESPFAAEEKRLGMKRAIAIANSKASINDYQIDYVKTCQSKCEFCNVPFKKSQIRILRKQSKKLWYHLHCFVTIHTSIDFLECGSAIAGFETLSPDDQKLVEEKLPGDNDNQQPLKKKRLSTEDDTETSMSSEDLNLKETMDIMYKYRGLLHDNLTREELSLLLTHNRQLVPGGIETMLDRASEMLTFGALERCRKCFKGQLVYTDNGYKCVKGSNSNWSRCKAVVDPNRMFVDVPLELHLRHTFLYNYEYEERKRIAPKIQSRSKKINKGPLKTKTFILCGFGNEEKRKLHSIIKTLCGRVVTEVRRSVFAIIATQEEVNNNTDDIVMSKERQVYVISEDFLNALTQEKDVWSLDDLAKKYSLVDWGVELHNRIPNKYHNPGSSERMVRREEEEKEGKRRMVIKGGIAIEPDSGLEHVAHVYQLGGTKFNVVLSRADVTKNYNTYYKIQLLEADNSEDYWVYRAWGRIGTSVGSFKVQKMNSFADAKRDFINTFERMTRNKWESRHCFVNKPGAYTMIEVNYDAKKEEIGDLCQYVADSTLKPAVAELMAIIFNVHAMEKMMLEYQLDVNKMPLGKLSRTQIKSAYYILTQANSCLQQKNKTMKQIVQYTNLFYTHMPHNSALARPPLLDNIELIKKKSEMLADLMELETAYAMIQRGAEGESGNILDGYYKQLNAQIEIVQANSDEFNLIQQYVTNTHADTHRNYDLKILGIFKVKRKGEQERYEPFKTMKNRRLLWHGSRTTNYAGILSQGLRIAPPEAPQTGYMFGKGIYFADMVSKSANYCYTSAQDTVGLMLLCEVALGNMQDKFNADEIKRLPHGINSIRGVGKTEPDNQAMKTLENGLQIPLGKPVTDIDCNSALMYNEYIVYDVSQVNIQYLLKMDFKFKNRHN